jgi:hypothetical protein
VGTLSGMDAYVALVSDSNALVAYVCDGDGHRVAEDFNGTIDQSRNGVLTLQGEHGVTSGGGPHRPTC